MNIEEYIASGILESYVAGAATEQERREVECMAKIYPELRLELDALGVAMEAFTQATAVEPPEGLKEMIMSDIEEESSESPLETPVIEMHGENQRTSMRSWQGLAVACVVAIVVMGIWAVSLNNDLRDSNLAIEKATKTTEQLESQITELQKRNEESSALLAVLSDPVNVKIRMGGLDISPESKAQVYWNEESGEVHLLAGSLPEPPADKQYQLWALVDGVPVDMGVFDNGVDTLQVMKQVESAGAFAVTLEDRGGSDFPTLEQMYVYGEV